MCKTNVIDALDEQGIRLIVNGSELLDPTNNNNPLVLQGFNWNIPFVKIEDGNLLNSFTPKANFVRIIGIFWDDSTSDNDCKSTNKSNGYIKESCITQMDNAIKIATGNNINSWNKNSNIDHDHGSGSNNSNVWATVTVRGKYAAGGDYPAYPGKFVPVRAVF